MVYINHASQDKLLRVLILTPSLPYPTTSGAALRNFGIIRGLAEAGYQITLLSFHDNNTLSADSRLWEYCQQIICVKAPVRSKSDRIRDIIFSADSDIARRLFSADFENALIKILQENTFDLIQFEGLELGAYFSIMREHSHAKICYDAHNAEAALQKVIYQTDRMIPERVPAAVYSWIQSRRIETFEAALCKDVDFVIAVSQEDANILLGYVSQTQVYVIPNGIHCIDYTKSNEHISLPDNALVFTGKMDYRPNVDAMLWFTDEILPEIENSHLYIIGQKPHSRLAHLQTQQNVSISGWVESIVPYLHAADIFIVPLRMGSGTRLKILEAMAAGCAIVATDIAAAGLTEAARKSLIIANSAKDFENAIKSLLQNPQKRSTMGIDAQTVVRQTYDWSVLIPRLLNIYEREVASSG